MLLSFKSVGLFSVAMMFDTLGNILLKKGMNYLTTPNASGWLKHYQTLKSALSSPYIVMGGLAMVLEAVVWLAFLSITPLNIAAPLSSANNIFILLASAWFLKEKVSRKRWLGVGLIITGIMFVSGNN